MANSDAPHGFKVWGPLLRARYYAVITAPTINIMVQDMVMAGNTGVSSGKLGDVQALEDANIIPATPGDANPLLGVVLACFDEDMDPVNYIAAGEAGDGTVAGYVLVADHPDQQFEAQEDADTAAIAVADIDLNFEIYSPALSAGNTNTGISKQEIDSNTGAVTATIPLRIYGMAYPEVDARGSAGCRWICGINPDCHFWAAGTAI